MNDELRKSSPWDVFIHLLATIAINVSAYAAILLLFDYIALALPDIGDSNLSTRSDIRYGAALLIVFFPAYIWAWRSIQLDLGENPDKRTRWIRTCPIYLTLFLAGLLVLIDLACLVYYFLNGEATTRFQLKFASVLLVGGATLIFYRDALRRIPGPKALFVRAFAFGTSAFAGALVIAAIATAGSPREARRANFDNQRVQDLEGIQTQILSYWRDKGSVPPALVDLQDSMSTYRVPSDPESNMPYGYRITGNTSFELCANFDLDNNETGRDMPSLKWQEPNSPVWNHAAGHVCYPRSIDPKRYPPNESKDRRHSS
jgi:hypothetical protein